MAVIPRRLVGNLNRTPRTKADAMALIEELRAEILNRPRAVVVESRTKEPISIRTRKPDSLVKERFDITISFGCRKFVFHSTICRERGEDDYVTIDDERPGAIIPTLNEWLSNER